MKLILSIVFIAFSFKLFAQDTIVVNIAHGSKPYKQFKEEPKTIGGKRGGHVVIQIDQFEYGFFFKGHRIHIFPHRRSRNGVFQKQTIKEWDALTKDKKVTKIFVPVTKEEKAKLLVFYNDNLKSPSYDYSFFGQRCASSVYNALKDVNKLEGGGYVFHAFHPAQLRKTILKQNEKHKYRITVKQGSLKRKWEGD
jgi:hypothetical protein